MAYVAGVTPGTPLATLARSAVPRTTSVAVRPAEPTYNRVLPGAELDQEREAGRKSKKMKMKKKKTERKEEM